MIDIDKIGDKWGYNQELMEALKRCIPVMIQGKTDEEIKLLQETLERVEIFTFESEPTQEQYDALISKKLVGRNNGVKEAYSNKGEYGKQVCPGVYVTEPIFDEDMNIVDRMGFVYITNLHRNSETAQFYGTDINLSHLIHELGHAWAAQKGEFVQEENGNYTMNVGALSTQFKVDRTTRTVEEGEVKGLFIEEAMNSIEEEMALYQLLGVKSYREIPGYIHSNYQGSMTEMIRHYMSILGDTVFREIRISKNRGKVEELQEIFNQTDFMKNIQTGQYYTQKEAEIRRYKETSMSDSAKQNVDEFLKTYHDLYFAPRENSNFLDYLDHVMEQYFNFNVSARYQFDINKNDIKEAYSAFLIALLKEGYIPINQVKVILEENNRVKDMDEYER